MNMNSLSEEKLQALKGLRLLLNKLDKKYEKKIEKTSDKKTLFKVESVQQSQELVLIKIMRYFKVHETSNQFLRKCKILTRVLQLYLFGK